MNTLGLVLVMGLLGVMVILGAVMVVLSIRTLRRRVMAGVNTTTQALGLSIRCCPLALGMLFVVWGIASINRIIGFDGMVVGATQNVITITAQTIPVVVIFIGSYLFLSHQPKA